MAAPNIDIIAASLRGCSLSSVSASFPSPISPDPAAVVDATDTTLELNSDLALPYHWEQCLDLKSGKIYYINWSTGAKSMEDPRKFAGRRDKYFFDSELEEEDDDGDDADDENCGVDDGDEDDDSSEDSITDSDEQDNCSSAFSSSSSSSSRDTIERGGGRAAIGSVLVAAGCRVCMMYVMIPKREEECPRCGGRVLHFGRSREIEKNLERE